MSVAGLSVGAKKLMTIRHWFKDTASLVIELVKLDQETTEWKYGPFSEKLLRAPFLWLNSTVDAAMGDQATDMAEPRGPKRMLPSTTIFRDLGSCHMPRAQTMQ